MMATGLGNPLVEMNASGQEINVTDLCIATAAGVASGAVAGATFGASLLVQGALAGATYGAINSGFTTAAHTGDWGAAGVASIKGGAIGAVAGAAGGVATGGVLGRVGQNFVGYATSGIAGGVAAGGVGGGIGGYMQTGTLGGTLYGAGLGAFEGGVLGGTVGVGLGGYSYYKGAIPFGPELNATNENSLVFDRYGTLRDSPIPGQAHHLNQNAAFGGVIPQNEGVSTKLLGNAFDQPGTPHYEAHDITEGFWDMFRPASPTRPQGIAFGEMPTNSQYNRALYNSLQEAGLTPAYALQLVRVAKAQQLEYGLHGWQDVPNLPNPINQQGGQPRW